MQKITDKKLRLMLARWRKTKDIATAYDICDMLAKPLVEIPVKYIPSEYKVEVRDGRNA